MVMISDSTSNIVCRASVRCWPGEDARNSISKYRKPLKDWAQYVTNR